VSNEHGTIFAERDENDRELKKRENPDILITGFQKFDNVITRHGAHRGRLRLSGWFRFKP
jgi:hypothetical protein